MKIIGRLLIFSVVIYTIYYLSPNEIKEVVKNIIFNEKVDKNKKDTTARITVEDYTEFKDLTFKHQYEEKYPLYTLDLDQKISYGRDNYIAQFIRGMRWVCITDAVEERYNLPHGFVFAMMMQETNGIEFLMNSQGDGGAGLCHMQPEAASAFGLKTFDNCTELICYEDASKLLAFINTNRSNRALLAETDERLDHVKNLDAVGRMLAYYISHTSVFNAPLRSALRAYTGTTNYEPYWIKVKNYINLFDDSTFISRVEQTFNKFNPNYVGGWNGYLENYCKLCDNYGLLEYDKLPKYKPKNSEIVLRTYRNFL